MKISTKHWLEFGKADLLNCEKILDDVFLTNIVAFHSQQAVEKCFKALIDEKDLTIPKVHNLIRLYDLIEIYLVHPIDTIALLSLDNVYISSRYPGDIGLVESGKPTLQEARGLYESAKNIFDTIVKLLEKLP